MKPAIQLVCIVLLVLVSFILWAEEGADVIEPSESDDSITVQPNGYFEFLTEHHLKDDVVSYGDLVDIINQLTVEKLSSFRDDHESQTQETEVTVSASNERPVSSRANRTWKRRILVLMDGVRVACTADRSMIIEDHLGVSLDDFESLKGFLSTDVDPSRHNYPRVLNFVSESPNHQELDKNESDTSEPEKTRI